MQIYQVCPDAWCANCYLLVSGTHAFIVDPSASADAILGAAKEHGVTPEAILLTHGHFDHIVSIDTLREKIHIPVLIHKDDAEMLTDGDKNAFKLFYGKPRVWKPADHTFRDGDTLSLGDETIRILHTPGHSRGSVCYLTDTGILTGDTLFSDNVGRTDLYGGDPQALADSDSSAPDEFSGAELILENHRDLMVVFDAGKGILLNKFRLTAARRITS